MPSQTADQEFLSRLPGGDLVGRGLHDLSVGRPSEFALLVLVAAPRLRRLGFIVPELPVPRPYEHQLYMLLEKKRGPGAYSYYNSLLRRVVSFARALSVLK